MLFIKLKLIIFLSDTNLQQKYISDEVLQNDVQTEVVEEVPLSSIKETEITNKENTNLIANEG